MKRVPGYVNTDLEITSRTDITMLTTRLEDASLMCPFVKKVKGSWKATLETTKDRETPDESLADFFKAIDVLEPEHREMWNGCSKKVFNIGFNTPKTDFHYAFDLSPMSIARIADLQAGVAFTIYRD